MEKIKFSVVEKFQLQHKICNETDLINGLKGVKMKALIEPIRDLFRKGENENANNLKKDLPAVLISGIFKGGRTAEKLEQYSKILCLDLDKLKTDEVWPLKTVISNDPYTFAVFISPSGFGLKILVKVSSGSNYHKDAYKQVLKYYERLTDKKFDQKTNDINRLTFMSYDPEVYYYPDSDEFEVETPIKQSISAEITCSKTKEEIDVSLFGEIFEMAMQLTKKKLENIEGSRNAFLHSVACYSNLYGLPSDFLLSNLDWCSLSENEKERTILSAYKKSEQFGTWQLPKRRNFSPSEISPLPKLTEQEFVVSELENRISSENCLTPANLNSEILEKTSDESPTLPSEVYGLLPDFLQGITRHFFDAREKDIVLLSTIGVLSSVFPNVKGLYRQSEKSLNLFELFVAPASSGKGQMKWSELLGSEIDKYLQVKYNEEYSNYIQSGGVNSDVEEPKEKKFFIGSDSSNIALASQMFRNENIGVMFDTEGSTLAQMFKNDWSNSLNILLRAFENESQSISRKSKLDSFTIKKCFLALVLSTTPNQLTKIVGSIESGLYSRFLIYYFNGEVKWKDHFSSEGDSLEPVFEEAAKVILNMYKANEESPVTIIYLAENQKVEIFDYFTRRLKEFYVEYDRDLLANVYRTCVIYYKIAMILSTVRSYHDSEELPKKIIIDDRDHRAAFLIVDTLLEHVKIVYETALQEQTKGIIGRKKILLESLPAQSFQKTKFLEISNKLNIKKATAEKWLNDFKTNGNVIKIDHGIYRKAA